MCVDVTPSGVFVTSRVHSLGLALFLATTDVVRVYNISPDDHLSLRVLNFIRRLQHLVATSLPTIASELPGPSTLYTWVGVAYILPQTVLQPLWGKMADITGRKVGPKIIGDLDPRPF